MPSSQDVTEIILWMGRKEQRDLSLMIDRVLAQWSESYMDTIQSYSDTTGGQESDNELKLSALCY